MTGGCFVTDIELLRHVMERPTLYVGLKSGSTVLAFFSGCAWARSELGQPPKVCDEIFEAVRLRLDPSLSPHNSHSLGMILRRVSGGDEARAFELLSAEVLRLLPPPP